MMSLSTRGGGDTLVEHEESEIETCLRLEDLDFNGYASMLWRKLGGSLEGSKT